MNGEKIEYRGSISAWMLMPYVLFFLLTLLFGESMFSFDGDDNQIAIIIILVGMAVLSWGILKIRTTEIVITNKRVVYKKGILSRKTIELNNIKVESFQVKQGVIQRLFGYGSLIIGGGGSVQEPLRYIDSPVKFRNAFFELQNGGD